MKPTGPRHVGDLLQSGDIARLRTEAKERRDLLANVRAALPPEQALHVVSASVDEGRIIVGMDSAAWAARLRYSADTLLGRPLAVRVTSPGETAS